MLLFDPSQGAPPAPSFKCNMGMIEEFWNMARDMYARARASLDPSTKLRLIKTADDYLKLAVDIERERVVVQAAFPKPDDRFGRRSQPNPIA